MPADGPAMIDFVMLFGSNASRAMVEADKKTQSNQPHAPRPTAVLLSRRPLVVFLCSHPPTLKSTPEPASLRSSPIRLAKAEFDRKP
jgi:hypothetical protein